MYFVIIFESNCPAGQFFIDTAANSQHYPHCRRKWRNIYLTIWYTVR